MTHPFFITGISTDVGKTLVSSIFVQALRADYWKPVQSGDLNYSDSHKLLDLVDFPVKIHPNSYALSTPMSPHESAKRDGITIDIDKIRQPKTSNILVIEGAGGISVPLNDKHTILDIVKPGYKVIVVSRHYLGSINHTLMTVEILKRHHCNVSGIVFSGNEVPSTESIIAKKTGVPIIGRVDETPNFNRDTVMLYAKKFSDKIHLI